ncbi:MAG: aminopeptidase P family protein [Chloroflexota bacterium]|nr:aminopeptidase P family protein [Dehalococcoidia bacterium]MDW8046643.1 aminopeptidase P family protein [Chloroflexota bacterium]
MVDAFERWASAVAARRERAARAWQLRDELVIVPAGVPIPIAGTDQFHEFHAHPEHYYLAGVADPGGVLTFDPAEGWTYFHPVVTQDEAVWTGPGRRAEEYVARTGLAAVFPVTALAGWLERNRGRALALLGNDDIVRVPGAYRLPGWHEFELAVDGELTARLREVVDVLRRTKDAEELLRIRRAVAASIEGHRLAFRFARPGRTERQIQIEIEAEFFRHGGDRTAYGSIVGSGPNGATLHVSPSRRALEDGDLVLIDAGAEVEGYASDITRTFPAGRRFVGLQRELYQLVLQVQEWAIGAAGPGVDYRDLHLGASRRLAEGLLQVGILRGSLDGIVERDVQALFFPHGLGHLLGLATHDAGGCIPARARPDRPSLRYLRLDALLEPGFVITIEPGLYFIPALLDDPEVRRRFAAEVDWERVDALRGFGGIRIEDDVLITETGAEVLSATLPKDIETIEALRAEALAG